MPRSRLYLLRPVQGLKRILENFIIDQLAETEAGGKILDQFILVYKDPTGKIIGDASIQHTILQVGHDIEIIPLFHLDHLDYLTMISMIIFYLDQLDYLSMIPTIIISLIDLIMIGFIEIKNITS